MLPAGCSAATAWHSAAAVSSPAGMMEQQQFEAGRQAAAVSESWNS
jgi:hypothetical protein